MGTADLRRLGLWAVLVLVLITVASFRDLIGTGLALLSTALGILMGMLLAKGVDYASAHYLPRFPYKPTTWFNFKWWIWMGGLACAAGFAVIGGLLPARRASRMEPAQALTQN